MTKKEIQEENIKYDSQIMPLMETIPLAWVQIIEGACVIDILHQCMLIDTKRDTVAVLNRINRKATE
jgi:cobalamin-dependent methionine synthase I